MQFGVQVELSGVPNNESQTDPLERRVVLLLMEERLRQDVSATKLAKQIGISRATVTHIEANRTRPGFWVLNRIADGLGLDLAEVIKTARKK